MEKDPRVSIVAAIAAAALSALIGVIAGVGFLALLLRALACGLLVGAAVYGCILLLRKMLPELLAPAAEEEIPVENQPPLETAAEGPPSGSNLDIVLPGDEGAPDILAPGEEAFVARPLAEASPQLPSESPGGAAEVERIRTPPEPPRRPVEAEAEELGGASLLEPESSFGGEEGEAAIPPNAAFGTGQRPSSGFDELDVLPDLDGFSDTFTASEFASGGDSSALRGGSERAVVPEGPLAGRSGQASGMDPAALAQAVRTILKRDQKG